MRLNFLHRYQRLYIIFKATHPDFYQLLTIGDNYQILHERHLIEPEREFNLDTEILSYKKMLKHLKSKCDLTIPFFYVKKRNKLEELNWVVSFLNPEAEKKKVVKIENKYVVVSGNSYSNKQTYQDIIIYHKAIFWSKHCKLKKNK